MSKQSTRRIPSNIAKPHYSDVREALELVIRECTAFDKAFKVLVRKLTRISKRLNNDPPPAMAIKAASAFFGFLSDLSVSDEALRPVSHAMNVLVDALGAAEHGNSGGPKPIPIKKSNTLGVAAAAVTALKKCGWSVADAVKTIGKEAKIDHRRLKVVRDNIHRGRANPYIFQTYHDWLDEFPGDADGVLTRMRFLLRVLC
jgi:hypothetical protein